TAARPAGATPRAPARRLSPVTPARPRPPEPTPVRSAGAPAWHRADPAPAGPGERPPAPRRTPRPEGPPPPGRAQDPERPPRPATRTLQRARRPPVKRPAAR